MGITIRFEFHLHINKTDGKQKVTQEDQADLAQSKTGFLEAATETAERLRPTLSLSTINNYKTALRSFSEYLEDKDLPVSLISQQIFKGYERWLLQKNVCQIGRASCRERV